MSLPENLLISRQQQRGKSTDNNSSPSSKHSPLIPFSSALVMKRGRDFTITDLGSDNKGTPNETVEVRNNTSDSKDNEKMAIDNANNNINMNVNMKTDSDKSIYNKNTMGNRTFNYTNAFVPSLTGHSSDIGDLNKFTASALVSLPSHLMPQSTNLDCTNPFGLFPQQTDSLSQSENQVDEILQVAAEAAQYGFVQQNQSNTYNPQSFTQWQPQRYLTQMIHDPLDASQNQQNIQQQLHRHHLQQQQQQQQEEKQQHIQDLKQILKPNSRKSKQNRSNLQSTDDYPNSNPPRKKARKNSRAYESSTTFTTEAQTTKSPKPLTPRESPVEAKSSATQKSIAVDPQTPSTSRVNHSSSASAETDHKFSSLGTSVFGQTRSRPKVKFWTEQEHEDFLRGLELFGKNWRDIQSLVRTKSLSQVQSHAQKHFLRIKNNVKSKFAIKLHSEKEQEKELNIVDNEVFKAPLPKYSIPRSQTVHLNPANAPRNTQKKKQHLTNPASRMNWMPQNNENNPYESPRIDLLKFMFPWTMPAFDPTKLVDTFSDSPATTNSPDFNLSCEARNLDPKAMGAFRSALENNPLASPENMPFQSMNMNSFSPQTMFLPNDSPEFRGLTAPGESFQPQKFPMDQRQTPNFLVIFNFFRILFDKEKGGQLIPFLSNLSSVEKEVIRLLVSNAEANLKSSSFIDLVGIFVNKKVSQTT